MKTLRTFPGQRVALGHQGENLALTVIFNIGAWADAYGPGTVHLSHKRSCDEEACPVAVTQEGTEVFWNVSSGDTAADGYGKYELRYVVGETVVKSSVGETYVRKALQYGTQPPEPVQGWLDHVAEKEHELLEAVADAKEFSEKASGAVDNALAQANAAGESARNAALATKNAMDFAGNAQLSAKDAAAEAGAAADSAADAKKSAEEAKKATEDFGGIKTVNGQGPDENGNVVVDAGGVKTVNGVEPDAAGNVQIEVGSGSGVDVTAQPGQLIRVNEVDEAGKPTAWEPVPWGWIEGGMVELPVAYKWPDNSAAQITAPIGLKTGNTYTVVWDGIEYEATAREEEVEGILAVVLGNTTGETAEPFMIAELPPELAAEMGFYGMAVDTTGGSYKDFSIYTEGEIVHPIPGKLLPDDVGGVKMFDAPFTVDGGVASTTMTFAEIYEKVTAANTIVRGIVTTDAGSSVFNLQGYSASYVVFSYVQATESNRLQIMSIIVNSDDTCTFATSIN